MREVTPGVVNDLRADLKLAGVGAPTARKALFILQSIMSLAEVRGLVGRNPVKAVKKPRQKSREVHPLAPVKVEAVRAALDLGDATLVSLLAYAGVRPSEALHLRWRGVRERTLLVYSTKTHKSRTVRLLPPLATDLDEWRMASGRPSDESLLFPRADEEPWKDHDYRNWRKRTFQPACEGVGISAIPYDLRHSFVSLLIYEGLSIVEVARQAGHSPTVCLSTYAHCFEEFDPAARIPAEDAIRAARTRSVPQAEVVPTPEGAISAP